MSFGLLISSILLSPAVLFSILEESCSKLLGAGEGKIFDELISLKTYASSLAMREPGYLGMLYNPYYTVLAYRGRNLVLARLQSGLNDLVAETWGRMLAFSGGKEVPVDRQAGMSEDIRSTAMGRSFIDDLPTSPQTLPLLYEMLKSPKTTLFRPAEAGSGRNFELDPGSVQEFLHTLKPIVESIAFLLQVTGSGPLRMSEVVGDRFRNGSRQRNLFISHSRVFLLRTDLKSSCVRGIRSHVVHYPPPKVVDLLVYYLSVVRPLETFLTGQLGWVDQQAAYYEFIYVIKGSVLTPRAFSDIIATYTERYFGCRLSGLDLRHVLINIQATFLPPIVDPLAQKFGDSQAGHGTPVANQIYGQRIDHLPGKEAAAFGLAYHWCGLLHKVLGVGPDAPCPPIPFLHAPSQPTWWSPSEYIPSAASLDTVISNMHCHITTSLAAATEDLSRSCQKILREAVYEAVATVWSTGGFTLPSQPPTNGRPATVPDLLELQPSVVSLTQLNHSPQPHANLTKLSRSDVELLSILSLYTGRHGSSFTSDNQKRLLCAALDLKQAIVLAILPTGSGKSIAIFGPVLAETDGVSVVITPYCALRRQLADQATALGIHHLLWNRRNDPESPDRQSVRLVIMVSDEFASEESQL